jgi:hypothetical protein
MASAALADKRIKIPGNFIYLGSVKGDRCLWGVGVEFPSVPGATSYTIDYWDGYYGADEAGGLAANAPKQAGMTKGMNYFGITGGGGPAPCVSDPAQGGRFSKPPKVYAFIPGKAPDGAIEGYITNRDGNPVEGATVTASGPAHATATSGPGGLYYMTVDKGHYRVVAEDGPAKTAPVTPPYADVDVAAQGQAEADFHVDNGLQVTMDLSTTTVPADGTSVVQGTLTTKQGGKPAPGTNVTLLVQETDPLSKLTTAPRVTICGPQGRIWPSGQTVTDLDGADTTVTTDNNGRYKFTLTVGTAPGSWSLDAWAQNQDGSLSPGLSNASDAKTLTIQPQLPTTKLGDFLGQLDNLAGTTLSSQINPTPGALAAFLGGLAAEGKTQGVALGGLVFSVGNGTDGQNVVISPAGNRFQVEPDGEVKPTASTLTDLIIDPQEWTGKGLPATFANLQAAMQAGRLHNIPTVAQWERGASRVLGWSLKPNKLSISTNSLAYFGWAYFPQAAWPTGYCN